MHLWQCDIEESASVQMLQMEWTMFSNNEWPLTYVISVLRSVKKSLGKTVWFKCVIVSCNIMHT